MKQQNKLIRYYKFKKSVNYESHKSGYTMASTSPVTYHKGQIVTEVQGDISDYRLAEERAKEQNKHLEGQVTE